MLKLIYVLKHIDQIKTKKNCSGISKTLKKILCWPWTSIPPPLEHMSILWLISIKRFGCAAALSWAFILLPTPSSPPSIIVIQGNSMKQLQKENFKMNPTVRCGEKGAKNGLEVRLDQKDDCAKTSTCHNLSIPGGLVSSTRHDNLYVPGVAGG